jgi:hypothetical protein
MRDYMLRKYRKQMSEAEAPERVAERVAYNEVAAQVRRETDERYPLTDKMSIKEMADVSLRSIEWSRSRIRQLMRERGFKA